MGIEDIIKMFKDHGISGLIFAIVIFIITSFIKSQWFGDWWSKSTDKFIEFFMKTPADPAGKRARAVSCSAFNPPPPSDTTSVRRQP